jgi:S1-C subfamily serine protease
MSPPVSREKRSRLGTGWLLLLIFLVGYLVAHWIGRWRSNQLHDPQARPKLVVPRGDLAADENATIELFREHSPAVVFITTERVGIDLSSFDERLLSQGAGSGFIWSQDGYIVTNDHVIAAANRAQVALFDQSVWRAELVGRASGQDLAVLKIDAPADRLQPIAVGRSSDLLVGQKVFAIGNPFGLDHTLTTGIISALDREIPANEVGGEVQARRTIEGAIQTDAAINPGNSGGPLLDSQGRLIGVNTAIYSPSGAYAGVGFAIPVDTVNRIVPQLIQHGRIIRPDIGMVPFNDQTTRRLGLTGVLVREIHPNSPAAQARMQGTKIVQFARGLRVVRGFRLGDLIVAADGDPIEDLDDWFSLMERHSIGDRITLTIIRDLQTPQQDQLDVEVTLGEPSD